jgi:phosphoribosylformylglycinamidine (FGAM) synthase-like enzyme
MGGANGRSRKPVWRRYDHMNGTNTLVGPGAGDAALLRIKGTAGAIAVALDGPGRLGALDPRLAARSAVVEAAANVAACGATPIGVTNCLNLGAPEPREGYWALAETVAGLAEACRALRVPIVSGNVSLYNETPAGPIVPAPLVGMVGLLEDRAAAVPMRWADGDEIWLLGAPAWDPQALAASELAWRRGAFGGAPMLDLDAGVRAVGLQVQLAQRGLLAGAHDLSLGGLGVALARMAIASDVGASVRLPAGAAASTTGAVFGERAGRFVVATRDGAALAEAAREAGVDAWPVGRAEGASLRIGIGETDLAWTLAELREAWQPDR